MISSKSCVISGLTFPFTPFWVYFCVWYWKVFSFHSFTYGWVVFPAPLIKFSSVQTLSRVQLFLTPCPSPCPSPTSLSITNSWRSLKLISIDSVMPHSHLTLCRPLLLLPSIFPSIRVFSNESALHIRLPKYWSFNFSISPSNEYSGLISLKIDWFDLVVQGTEKGANLAARFGYN